ncbi:MAG TPA: lytic transglycosylase domain-containing protein [Thermoanaerobaculia bacterium]|jgi:membrane-bound lytic murein transglycosylase D|nr:lytic transglycosylase domain-containing protein [Thermoanaerobaculia bacterium]
MKKNLILTLVFVSCASAPTAPTATAPAITPAPAPATDRAHFADIDHPRVDYHLTRFTGEKRAEFASYLQRKSDYEQMIRAKLRRRGMPEELLYLAMVESGFNPTVHSLQEAVGIWQLVPDTARRYGLRVDATVDERTDAEKSTDAALSYLSYLYNRFGSWYLAAAAYNAGENRISRVMEKGTDADYFRVWDQLPGETRDYVPAMIAAMRIARDPSRYGF